MKFKAAVIIVKFIFMYFHIFQNRLILNKREITSKYIEVIVNLMKLRTKVYHVN